MTINLTLLVSKVAKRTHPGTGSKTLDRGTFNRSLAGRSRQSARRRAIHSRLTTRNKYAGAGEVGVEAVAVDGSVLKRIKALSQIGGNGNGRVITVSIIHSALESTPCASVA